MRVERFVCTIRHFSDRDALRCDAMRLRRTIWLDDIWSARAFGLKSTTTD